MAEIPAPDVTQEDISEWWRIQQQLSDLKTKESLLRNRIFKAKFQNPVEGTNKFPLADGWQINATHVVNRSIDRAALASMSEEFAKLHINVADLVEYKPELKIGAYRKLTAEQQRTFDSALVIKDGTPQMKIELPKRAVK